MVAAAITSSTRFLLLWHTVALASSVLPILVVHLSKVHDETQMAVHPLLPGDVQQTLRPLATPAQHQVSARTSAAPRSHYLLQQYHASDSVSPY